MNLKDPFGAPVEDALTHRAWTSVGLPLHALGIDPDDVAGGARRGWALAGVRAQSDRVSLSGCLLGYSWANSERSDA
jgi:hypothetical protein